MTVNSKITMKNTFNQFYSMATFVVKLTNDLSLLDTVADDIGRSFERFHEKQFMQSEVVKMIPDGVQDIDNG